MDAHDVLLHRLLKQFNQPRDAAGMPDGEGGRWRRVASTRGLRLHRREPDASRLSYSSPAMRHLRALQLVGNCIGTVDDVMGAISRSSPAEFAPMVGHATRGSVTAETVETVETTNSAVGFRRFCVTQAKTVTTRKQSARCLVHFGATQTGSEPHLSYVIFQAVSDGHGSAETVASSYDDKSGWFGLLLRHTAACVVEVFGVGSLPSSRCACISFVPAAVERLVEFGDALRTRRALDEANSGRRASGDVKPAADLVLCSICLARKQKHRWRAAPFVQCELCFTLGCASCRTSKATTVSDIEAVTSRGRRAAPLAFVHCCKTCLVSLRTRMAVPSVGPALHTSSSWCPLDWSMTFQGQDPPFGVGEAEPTGNQKGALAFLLGVSPWRLDLRSTRTVSTAFSDSISGSLPLQEHGTPTLTQSRQAHQTDHKTDEKIDSVIPMLEESYHDSPLELDSL